MLQWKGYLVFEFLYQVIAINRTWDKMINCLWISFAQDYPSSFFTDHRGRSSSSWSTSSSTRCPSRRHLGPWTALRVRSPCRWGLAAEPSTPPSSASCDNQSKIAMQSLQIPKFYEVGKRFVNLIWVEMLMPRSWYLTADNRYLTYQDRILNSSWHCIISDISDIW